MATLTRPRTAYESSDTPGLCLDTSIPKPFPSKAERQFLLQDELLDELATERVGFDLANGSQAGSSRLVEPLHISTNIEFVSEVPIV